MSSDVTYATHYGFTGDGSSAFLSHAAASLLMRAYFEA